MRWLLLACLAACSFHAHELNGSDAPGGDGSTIDGAGRGSGSGSGFVPLHVPPAGQAPGTGDLTITSATTIDTSGPTISTTLPAGVTFDTWMQPGGPELAVLHVKNLTINADVAVTGTRAFVVIASGDITITASLDASANLATPGPGGSLPGAGTGKGGTGGLQNIYYDSGGGGAGYGTAGAHGGASSGGGATNVPGGTAGAQDGDAMITTLIGGSGGGDAAKLTCGSATGGSGGAGGGALQLSTPGKIMNSGRLLAGGGGGDGGTNCTATNQNWGAGGGGGAGGSIVLQAAVIANTNVIAANGGGGGGGAGEGSTGDPNGVGAHGNAGENGQASATPATGGPNQGAYSSDGGAGGAGTTSAQVGADYTAGQGNGGGGGGAVGRIVFVTTSSSVGGTVSPPALFGAF